MQKTKYPYKILFVEDEKIIRENYVEYLNIYYDEVYEAENGEIAYHLYKEIKPDIMIIDIHIPKLNGIELLKKIRENDQNTKAIMLTALTDVTTLQDAASLKLTEYLIKPVSSTTLRSTLNKVILELSQFKVIPIKIISLKDNCHWNALNQELNHNGKIIYLTNKEQKIFKLFMDNINSILSIDTILYSIWDDNIETNLNTFKTLLKTLRKKLPKGMIVNVHGRGYKIDC